jgi:hypothetical protein
MTGEERARVRQVVERTCAAQGIPLAVPQDVARAVATMIARRRRPGPHQSPLHASVEVDAGDDRASAPAS